MKKKLICLLLIIFFLLTACGVEEIYYLPQVPEPVTRDLYTAIIEIPSSFRNEINNMHYASGYRIFYRIYLSDRYTGEALTILDQINSTLDNDFRFFDQYADPSTTSIISSTTFSSRGFFELFLDESNFIGKNLVSLEFIFQPNSNPFVLYINGNDALEVPLKRSERLNLPTEEQRFLRYVEDLKSIDPGSNNSDVVQPTGNDAVALEAYVAMYIVVIGTNDNFATIVSGKPTFINVFRLQ